jgi:hypothetical protein
MSMASVGTPDSSGVPTLGPQGFMVVLEMQWGPAHAVSAEGVRIYDSEVLAMTDEFLEIFR